MTASTTQFVNCNGLSSLLGLPAAFLDREAKAGRIPYTSTGNRKFFDPDVVKEALASAANESDDCADDQRAATRYLTAAQVADRLNVKVHQIITWTASGTIPRIQIEHTTRYDWTEVEAALAERTGFQTTRPHRCVGVITLTEAAARLDVTKVALRRLSESGDVPSYKNGTGKGARFFFCFDDLWGSIIKLGIELNPREYNAAMRGNAASK